MILDFLSNALRDVAKEHEPLLSAVVDEIRHQEDFMVQLNRIMALEPEGGISQTWENYKQAIAQIIPAHRTRLVTTLANLADGYAAEQKYKRQIVRAQLASKDLVH